MQHIKQHLLFKIGSLLLVLCVMAPDASKVMHVFSHTNHKHEVCLGEPQAHFHTLDLDCEFYKFHINTAYTLANNTYTLLKNQNSHQPIKSQYTFISEFQQLHFSLRGPPFIS